MNVPRIDEVYIECLIRSNFDENEGFEILMHRRPNLVNRVIFISEIFFKSLLFRYCRSKIQLQIGRLRFQ